LRGTNTAAKDPHHVADLVTTDLVETELAELLLHARGSRALSARRGGDLGESDPSIHYAREIGPDLRPEGGHAPRGEGEGNRPPPERDRPRGGGRDALCGGRVGEWCDKGGHSRLDRVREVRVRQSASFLSRS